jgi:hypothetical protein
VAKEESAEKEVVGEPREQLSGEGVQPNPPKREPKREPKNGAEERSREKRRSWGWRRSQGKRRIWGRGGSEGGAKGIGGRT